MTISTAPSLPRVAFCQTDEAETRLLRNVLQEEGYPMSLIRKPETIIALLLRTKAPIVILNFPFEKSDRNELIKTIRMHPRLQYTYIIALVPVKEATDTDIAQAWRAGVTVYETKPVTRDAIAAMLAFTTRSVRGKPT